MGKPDPGPQSVFHPGLEREWHRCPHQNAGDWSNPAYSLGTRKPARGMLISSKLFGMFKTCHFAKTLSLQRDFRSYRWPHAETAQKISLVLSCARRHQHHRCTAPRCGSILSNRLRHYSLSVGRLVRVGSLHTCACRVYPTHHILARRTAAANLALPHWCCLHCQS